MAMHRPADKPKSAIAEPQALQSADRTTVRKQTWLFAAGTVLLGLIAGYGVVVLFMGRTAVRPPVVPAGGPAQSVARQPIASSPDPSARSPFEHVQGNMAYNTISPAEEQKQAATVKAAREVKVQAKGHNENEQTGADRPEGEMQKRSHAAATDAPVRVEPSDRVIEFSQLPLAVRKGLPEIKISSHLYRKDSRLVSINGRIMSEGYNMDDGLFLEEITPDGVILRFERHRFLVKAAR